MRADRLVATLLVLQAKGRVTAAELAAELEISERTARRDLEALAIAGIPVYSQPGRGGGWSLIGGATTDLSGLTATEARTLFLLAGPASTVAPEAKSALRKLVQALPETFRTDAEKAAGAVVLDPARWGGRVATTPPHLETLQGAVIDGVQVILDYSDRTRAVTTRRVHPLGLVEKGSVWYFVGDTDSGLRTFRLNRIRKVTVTDDPLVRPDGFDLATTWKDVVAQIEEIRTVVRARVRVPLTSLPGLRGQFGSGVTVLEERDDGRVDVEIGAASAGMIAQQLAGWGHHLEVVEPDEVRHHLARIGAELTTHYGPPPPDLSA